MKIEKILLGFDDSVHSVNACKYVLKLAILCGAHVTIVHCYEWHANTYEISEPLIRELKRNIKKEAEDTLKQAEKFFTKQGVQYKLEVVAGSPGYVLTHLAKSKEYDLIVMGSHGHSDIAGLFLGSVTHKVLNRIHCPVMVVP